MDEQINSYSETDEPFNTIYEQQDIFKTPLIIYDRPNFHTNLFNKLNKKFEFAVLHAIYNDHSYDFSSSSGHYHEKDLQVSLT